MLRGDSIRMTAANICVSINCEAETGKIIVSCSGIQVIGGEV